MIALPKALGPATSSFSLSFYKKEFRAFNKSASVLAGKSRSMSHGNTETQSQEVSKFKILKEELCYSRYLNVYNRVVEFPSKTTGAGETEVGPITVEYDIVGSKIVSHRFATVFPFDLRTKSVTLIKEYAQGANGFVYGIPCGGLTEKHTSLEDCARKELSEEAHLTGGRLIKLLPNEHPGILEVKWCQNRFIPYLVLDPQVDPNPKPKDLEEIIEVLNTDVPTLLELMHSGDMLLPSFATCTMALEYLRKNAYL